MKDITSRDADGPTGIGGSPEHIGNRKGNGTPFRLQHGGDLRDPLDERAARVILGRVI